MTPSLLVSIHDVTPAFEHEVQHLWDLCRRHRATPALLVVPDWHGAWPLPRYPAYVEWLRARAQDGAEIVLHGERHDEVGLDRSLSDSLRAVGRTNREGEFLTLGTVDARERIERGLSLLRSFSLNPVGFIPPAWLAREVTHAVVGEAGLHFSEDAHTVRLHRSGKRLRAPALRWSARTSFRAHASSAVAAFRWRWHAGEQLVRIALHPQDLSHPVVERSIERELARWTARCPVIRYEALS